VNVKTPRHSVTVRLTHWITFVSFLALLVSGLEIVISHPRFYWGNVGNVNTHPLFAIPIPSSRGSVPTGYSYTMPDANGWSRYLHFQTAWVLVFAGLVYVGASLLNGHLRRDLLPAPGERSWRAPVARLMKYLRREPGDDSERSSYNPLQRVAYLVVIFVLFPLLIWTGLAMSPSFVSALPATAELLGGRQSARTLHFFATIGLVLFFVVHVGMVAVSGFADRMRGMITGDDEESTASVPAEERL
jgi:thiosulfate reductase cytochrome b subunit